MNELPTLLQFLSSPVDMKQLVETGDSDLIRFCKKVYFDICSTGFFDAFLGQVASKYIAAIGRSSDPWDQNTIKGIESLREARDELVFLRQALTWQKVRNLFGKDNTY